MQCRSDKVESQTYTNKAHGVSSSRCTPSKLVASQPVPPRATGDLRFHSGLALSYKEMADLQVTSATRAKGDVERSAQSWRDARHWYQRSLDVWLGLEHRGVTAPAASGEKGPERSRAMSRCSFASGSKITRRSALIVLRLTFGYRQRCSGLYPKIFQ